MANTVGSLVVKLSAHTAEFTSGLQKAGASAKSFGSNMSFIQGIGGNSAVMLSGVAGAALGAAKAVYELGGAFVRMATQQAQAMVDTMRMANRMDMASEQLVALKEAAEQFGVADLIGQALSRMNVKIGQGAMGNEGAQKAFANIGLDAMALAQMDTSDKYKAIADAIQNLGNVSLQAAAAQAIFGKAGKDLIGLLSGGSAAIEKAAQDTRDMGTAFTDGDAAVSKLATEGLRECGEVLEGLRNKLAVALAPAIAECAKNFVDMIQAIKPGLMWLMETVGGGLSWAFHGMQTVFARISESIMEIIRVLAMMLADVLDLAANLPTALGGDWFKEQADSARAFADELARIREEHANASIHAGPDEKVAAARKKAADAAKQRAELRMAPMPDLASNLSSAKWEIAKAIVVGTRDYMNMLVEMGQKKPEMDEMKKQTRLQQQIRDRLDFAEGEF